MKARIHIFVFHPNCSFQVYQLSVPFHFSNRILLSNFIYFFKPVSAGFYGLRFVEILLRQIFYYSFWITKEQVIVLIPSPTTQFLQLYGFSNALLCDPLFLLVVDISGFAFAESVMSFLAKCVLLQHAKIYLKRQSFFKAFIFSLLQTNPPGLFVNVKVMISFHEEFITKVDRVSVLWLYIF